MNMKITSYKSSQYVVDHILPHFNNKSNGSEGPTGIIYNACPSTVRFDTHNLDMYTVETEITKFKVKTPIIADPTTIIPSPVDSSVPESVDTVIVSKDSEGTELTKEVMPTISIPAENHIFYEPAEDQKAKPSTSQSKDAPCDT